MVRGKNVQIERCIPKKDLNELLIKRMGLANICVYMNETDVVVFSKMANLEDILEAIKNIEF